MIKLKKFAITVLTVTSLAASALIGISASASGNSVEAGNGYAKLTNNSGTSRYGIVSLNVLNRSTGSTVARKGNEAVLSDHSSVTASASGYSAVTYRFVASGTLYNGTSVQSGSYWSGSDTY